MTPLAWLALVTFIVWFIFAIDIMYGNRTIRALRDVTPELPNVVPPVSVIVAARNESRNIRSAIQSLLSLNYPDYELIVVDDRSDDDTGSILDEMDKHDSRLRVIHLSDLPSGWLGKNHALWRGASESNGEILLFTDADIIMEPTVLSRAVHFFLEREIHHLAVSPSMTMPTTFLQMFGASFIIFFSIFARPWKARDPKSSYHTGIGAFNMVSRDAYKAVGGHEAIRLRPDDDIKLGKIIKKGGFRSDVAYGPDFLSVEWYSSLGEVIRGLEKNAFSGCDYRISLALFGVIFHLLATIWPYLAIFLTCGITRSIYIFTVLLLTVLFADCATFHASKRWYAVGFPLSTLLFVWILLRTMVLNLSQGGIQWRGTFYSLKELKGNRV
ncbi:putative glycosyltransferase YdaM [Geobacter sp. OR-1]|uniref:glycosyltransferase n=1 Tax=Geobacter sp. OR-1 TaxID=1266765 RepID=UPI000541FD2E|nr:glycosyltransferase [Geobacter sp. OR-1]GAM10414.1 putative glycosyltransferase YdaM [Geobacter sp. OR-1]